MNAELLKEDGRAFGTNTIEIYFEYLDPSFECIPLSNIEITPTGLLNVGKLESADPTLPMFIFRWDDKQDALDVDILNVSATKRALFKARRLGYRGHHTARVSGDGRAYYCDIDIKGRTYFKGLIGVRLVRKLTLQDAVHVTDHPVQWVLNKLKL